jgi:hypothetical protein
MEGKFYRHKTPFHPHTVCLSLSVLNEIEPHADLMHWCDVMRVEHGQSIVEHDDSHGSNRLCRIEHLHELCGYGMDQ